MSSDDFVPLIVARNADEVEYYRTLLDDHDIEVEIDESSADDEGGVTILVPDDALEEARHVLEQRSTLDDEFEVEFDDDFDDEDEDDDDFDGYEEIDEDEDSGALFGDDEVEDYYDEEDDEYY